MASGSAEVKPAPKRSRAIKHLRWPSSIGILLLVLVSGLLAQCALSPRGGHSRPRAADLLAAFPEARPTLVQLVQMMNEDTQLVRITLWRTEYRQKTSARLDRQRIRHYRRLMRQAQVRGVSRDIFSGAGALWMHIWGSGWSGREYCYTYGKGQSFATLVDTPQAMDSAYGLAFLLYHIDQEWCLYYRDTG